MTLLITRPIAEMSAAKKALQAKASQVIDRQQGEGETKTDVIDRLGGMKAIRADVATSLITGTIDAAQGTQPTVLIVADIDALTGIDENAESTIDNQRVDPTVIHRLCCDGIIQTAILGENGTEKATGSESRIVPRRIRRLLLRRDHGMCQFPGCEAEQRLHAHHVVHWAQGGATRTRQPPLSVLVPPPQRSRRRLDHHRHAERLDLQRPPRQRPRRGRSPAPHHNTIAANRKRRRGAARRTRRTLQPPRHRRHRRQQHQTPERPSRGEDLRLSRFPRPVSSRLPRTMRASVLRGR